MSLAHTPKCDNYSRRISSPFIKVTRCSEVWTLIMLSAVEGCAAVPLRHSRCLPLVSCYTTDVVIECSIFHSSPVIRRLAPVFFTSFTIVHLQRLPPTRPVLPKRVHYLFHLNKIKNTEHASHSNQFQLRQHNQTKRCTHFSVDLNASRLSHFLPAALLEDILFSLRCHCVNQCRCADVGMQLLKDAQPLMIIRQENPYRNQSAHVCVPKPSFCECSK